MPIFEHECLDCELQWEDWYQPSELPPDCPDCKSKNVKKLISLCANGRVELTGHELRQKLRSDANKIKQKAMTDQNTLADIVGHDNLHKNELKKKS